MGYTLSRYFCIARTANSPHAFTFSLLNSNSRRFLYNLPRPLRLSDPSQQPLTSSDKVDELLYSMDTDDDDSADPWELHEWIAWVQNAVYRLALSTIAL